MYPKFVSSSDYHLQSGSPVINAGDPAILDPDGSRSDMGAYYFSGGAPADTTPPVISNVQTVGAITLDTASIVWNTDEPTYTSVKYGLTTSYGNTSASDGNNVTLSWQAVSNVASYNIYLIYIAVLVLILLLVPPTLLLKLMLRLLHRILSQDILPALIILKWQCNLRMTV